MSDFLEDEPKVPFYDTSDPEQVALVQNIADIRHREQLASVRAVCDTYEGRTFIWMLIQEAGGEIGGPTIFAGEAPMTMAWNEGRRTIGGWGADWVFTAAPEKYMVMKREATEREKLYAERVGFVGIQEEE